MNKLFFFIAIVLSLAACSQKKEVTLFNGLTMKLNDQETNVQIENSQYILDKYTAYLDDTINVNIPLYKYIKHPNYVIFIGLPLNNQMTDFFKDESYTNAKTNLENKTDKLSYCFSRKELKNSFVSKYVFEKSENMFLVLGITENKIVSDSLLNYNELSNRFIENQD